MTALERLAELDYQAKQKEHPGVPYLPRSKFSDKDANSLTKAVLRWISLNSGYAVRINTQGQYNESLGRWTQSTTRRGTADIHAVINGLHISIEIKIGRDALSKEQKQTAEDVERAGGRYIVARTFEGFCQEFQFISQSGGVSIPSCPIKWNKLQKKEVANE